MNKTLTIVASIEAKPDRIDLVKTELQKLIIPTLKETGCLQYDLHQDNQNPAIFLFFENWESRELWQDHMNNSHLAAFAKATEGATVSIAISEMTKV